MTPKQVPERRSRKSLVLAVSVWLFGGLLLSAPFSPRAAQAQMPRVIACATSGCSYPPTQDLSTTQPVQGVQQVFACQSIKAGPYPIASNGQITFTAGQTIVLRPGFSVAASGTFRAVIDPNLAP